MATTGPDHDLGADGSLPCRPGDLPGGQDPDGAAINLTNADAHHAAPYGHAEINRPGHPNGNADADADADREGHADQLGVPDADQLGRPDRHPAPVRHADAITVLDRQGSQAPRSRIAALPGSPAARA